MMEGVRPAIDFAELRSAAIGFAQDASGNIWTDYNLHDPGVTLLEQTCFALSELTYLADHDLRDLLTSRPGHFSFRDLALFKPRQVLETAPVTRGDFEAWLADCPDVAWASVATSDQGPPCLYDVTIAPTDPETDGGRLCDDIRAAFEGVRPLCCDLGRLRVAVRQKAVLTGAVEITPIAIPELVAAELYHAVSNILQGRPPAVKGKMGATRADAYDAPEVLLGVTDKTRHRSSKLDARLVELRDLPGIRNIGELFLDPLPCPEGSEPGVSSYLASVLPRTKDEIGLKLTLNGAPVTLNAVRIRQEYLRISAERIAHAHDHTDRGDWAVMRPGRHRGFDIADVDSLLPMLYRAHDHAADTTSPSLGRYRSAIGAFLKDLAHDLDTLPATFKAESDAATRDPARHRLRVALLDYLIALQGEEMPVTRHSGMHLYRTTRMQHDFEISWRTRYLLALPRINGIRATGPNLSGPGGFMTKFGILADLDVQDAAALADPLTQYGLDLTAETNPSIDTDDEPDVMLPADPLDMLVAEDETAQPLSPNALLDLSPWIRDGLLDLQDFERLADPDNLYIAPLNDGAWQILLDRVPGDPPCRLAVAPDQQAAKTCVNQLRATWRNLHQRSEGALLIEDILLRDDTGEFTGNTADLLLTGWTARCNQDAYRHYVEHLVEQLSPAHIVIRIHWLTLPDMIRVSALWDHVKRGQPGAPSALRACLRDLASSR